MENKVNTQPNPAEQSAYDLGKIVNEVKAMENAVIFMLVEDDDPTFDPRSILSRSAKKLKRKGS